MSAKQEPALAPATVSHADAGLTPQQPNLFQHQPHPPNYHQGQIIYQQSYGPVIGHYQQQGPPVWNQPPQAAMHFVPYAPQQEPMVFPDNKVQSYNHYGTVHFAQPMDNGEMMMRGPQPPQQAFVPQPQQYITSQQWYPAAQTSQGQFIPTYATTFNVANDPTYHPNHPMNRPAVPCREDYTGGDSSSAGYLQFMPFVPPIGVMESQAHASASYTANWVSSTSSIPPEMKDEPESDNISQYDSQRPTSQMNGDNWTDPEDHLSPTTTQHSFQLPPTRSMQFVEKDKSTSQSTTKTSKNTKGDRSEGKRELTFDERLEKARMQKCRVENEGANGSTSPNTAALAQGSNTINSSTSAHTPRSNGQRKENIGTSRHEGYNNNSNNHNINSRGRNVGGSNHHHYNGNNSHNGEPGEEEQQQNQQYYQNQQPRHERGNAGNAIGERDRQSKRDNNYINNRFENNQQNSSYNQKHQYQQNQSRDGGHEFYRPPGGHRGGRGSRGGYRGGFQPQGLSAQHQPGTQQSGGASSFVPPQPMSPQVMATMNAFQNAHIALPPGVPRIPLLPGPFGMPRQHQLHQDVKFHNTWLDAASCPMPLSAVMNIDTRFGRGGGIPYRGRNPYRGHGYRGGYRGGYVNNRFVERMPDIPIMTVPRTPEPESAGSIEAHASEEQDDQDVVQSEMQQIVQEIENPQAAKVSESKENSMENTDALLMKPFAANTEQPSEEQAKQLQLV